jgi:thiol-disulfide isomerase/thioredoxin
MKKKPLFSSILLSTILFSTGCTQQHLSTNKETPSTPVVESFNNVETNEPSIETPTPTPTTSSGEVHQLSTVQGETITVIENGNIGFKFPQFAGKVIIFQIFGKECEFCSEELPIINQIKRQYGSRLQVVSIQAQEKMTPSELHNIINTNQIDYPIIEGGDARSLLRFITQTYGWNGILPYILILKDGATEYSFADGGVGYKELQESVASLL